ncbi:MAG: MFS transporter [Thermomicrobiales bacterium]
MEQTIPTSLPLAVDRQATQRRVVTVLALAQTLGGIGVASGSAVGALLAADLSSEKFSGLAAAASVVGAALIAIPVSRLMDERGRRPGLLLAYAFGLAGAMLVILGAIVRFFPLTLLGLMAVGGGTTATLQSRYAATDLVDKAHRGRALATVVWATTIGSVLGPNLSSPMGDLGEKLGIPRLAGPYLLTGTVFVLSALLVGLLLRPDPLLVARAMRGEAEGHMAARPKRSMRDALATIFAIRAATLGFLSVVAGHAVMVAVMSMTPVHLHDGGGSLEVIGIVISLHIAGMYAASPLVGVAADRYGRIPVIVVGCLILLAAFATAGTASGHEAPQLAVGLAMLGLGWSCTMIAGSTLLTDAVPSEHHPNVQGTTDVLMGFGGASAGLISGMIVGFGSYGLLTIAATCLIVPLLVSALRAHRARATVIARA